MGMWTGYKVLSFKAEEFRGETFLRQAEDIMIAVKLGPSKLDRRQT